MGHLGKRVSLALLLALALALAFPTAALASLYSFHTTFDLLWELGLNSHSTLFSFSGTNQVHTGDSSCVFV